MISGGTPPVTDIAEKVLTATWTTQESAETKLTKVAKLSGILAYGSSLPRSVIYREAMPSVDTSWLTTLAGIVEGAAYRITDC